MTATVRLDEKLEFKLNNLANTLHKKKSDIIREAIEQYVTSVEKEKKSKLQLAIEKTKDIDKKEIIKTEISISASCLNLIQYPVTFALPNCAPNCCARSNLFRIPIK